MKKGIFITVVISLFCVFLLITFCTLKAEAQAGPLPRIESHYSGYMLLS